MGNRITTLKDDALYIVQHMGVLKRAPVDEETNEGIGAGLRRFLQHGNVPFWSHEASVIREATADDVRRAAISDAAIESATYPPAKFGTNSCIDKDCWCAEVTRG